MRQGLHSGTARRFLVPLTLTGLSLVLAFWQRPLGVYSDTRVEMVTNPGLFLERIAAVWTPTIDLGHVQTSQFVGYLFPMGPFFAAGDAIGLPMWLVQRLWIGLLLAVAAWGVVRLVEELRPSTGQASLFLAGLIYLSSPFITVSLNRGTIWLIPYALLPWMLLATNRGIRRPTGWLAPAALAIMIAACSTGVTPLVWLIAAVALLGLFEAITGEGLGAVLSFAWRAALLSLVASLWWIVPVAIQARYGSDYLTFTEHPEAILNTPSASESLRLLGYWVSYVNGYPDEDPQLPAMSVYLLSAATVAATFLVPAAAISAVAFMRRWRYAPFFALMLALAVLAMSLGFPQEGAVGSAVTDLYYGSGPFQFLRTTYKAAPLAGLSIAVLAGILLGTALERLWRLRLTYAGREVPSAALWLPATVVVAVLLVMWGRPLWAGDAIDERLVFDGVPNAWTQALDNAQETTPADSRIMVLPGELFAWYRWAGTQNSVAPGLSRRPVLIRQIVRSSPPAAAQLLESVDTAIQQDRLTPDQLPPLLRLMGVGRVLVPSDPSPERNDRLDPARASQVLAAQPGFQKPAATFGEVGTFSPPADRSGPTVKLPEVSAFAAPRPAYPRITRVHPASEAKIVDGDAAGVVSLAAVGALDPLRATFYAGDMDDRRLADRLSDNPTLVFTDSNRRNFGLVARVAARTGQTLPAGEKASREFPNYDPFPELGEAGQTVAVYGGISRLSAPASPGFTIFPEHRPFAALDGDPNTTWIAQTSVPEDQWMEVGLTRPLEAGAIQVKPHYDPTGATREIAVSSNGGAERVQPVSPGWNRVAVGPGPVNSIRIRVVTRKTIYGRSPAGLDEIRIPGVRVTEALRLPTDLATAASGLDVDSSPMQVVTERVTADFPRRSGKRSQPPFNGSPVDMGDAETGMRRIVTLPAARGFSASGWASLRPQAPDPSIDALAGMKGASRYSSSGRWEGLGTYRASSAFDGNRETAWISEFSPYAEPWVEWSGSSPVSVRSLKLVQYPGQFRQPTRVEVSTPMGGFNLRVLEGGRVTLPTTVTTDRLRIKVLRVKQIPNISKLKYPPRAVAFSEVQVPGIPRAAPRRSGRFSSGCGAVRVASRGTTQQLAISGRLEALDNGTAVKMERCSGGEVQLRKGANDVRAIPGEVFAPDHLLLDGPARDPVARAPQAGSVGPDGKVRLSGPGWLVLGESYSPGWKAWCRDEAGREYGLGSPLQADGYANGWRIDGNRCSSARFAFGPQGPANIAYAISAVALLVMLVLLAVWRIRRPGRSRESALEEPAGRDGDDLEINPHSGGTPAVVLRSGVPGAGRQPAVVRAARILAGCSGFLVLITGAIYVANPDTDPQGVNFDYPLHHLGAHYVALVAMILLAAGGLLGTAGTVLARRESRSG